MSATTFVVVFIIATDYINWDRLNHGFLPSNELTRSFGASFILVMDILIVTQVSTFKFSFTFEYYGNTVVPFLISVNIFLNPLIHC